MQALTAALADVTALAGHDPAGMAAAVADANSAGEEAIQLFVQMRKFIRDGDVARKPIPLQRVIERAVRIACGYVRERAVLRIAELPVCDVMIAEALFLQVIANLLRNAANASPTGGIVDVAARITDTEVIITVTDDGPGVAPEIADTMFEPFASTTREGTGLGLAISAYVVQMLEGRISYRRDHHRGACFTVTIARAK